MMCFKRVFYYQHIDRPNMCTFFAIDNKKGENIKTSVKLVRKTWCM